MAYAQQILQWAIRRANERDINEGIVLERKTPLPAGSHGSCPSEWAMWMLSTAAGVPSGYLTVSPRRGRAGWLPSRGTRFRSSSDLLATASSPNGCGGTGNASSTRCGGAGGGVVTAGGLLFIGATNHDRKFRAYDKATGKILWETTLPAAGNATPATYMVNGRQYLVVAVSGSGHSGELIAFRLPS